MGDTLGFRHLQLIEQQKLLQAKGRASADALSALALEAQNIDDGLTDYYQLTLAREQAGEIGPAIRAYEWLVGQHYLHPGPYQRLRLLYTQLGHRDDAIGVSYAFLDLEQVKTRRGVGPLYPAAAAEFSQWIKDH